MIAGEIKLHVMKQFLNDKLQNKIFTKKFEFSFSNIKI